MQYDEELKFVVLGESRVGKTSILSRYFSKGLNESVKSTVHSEYFEKILDYQGKKFNIKFWDTFGQEQLNAINSMYYINAVGALLVYDVTIPETFEKVKNWVLTLHEAVGKDIIIVIVGNKFDLANENMINECNKVVDIYCNQVKCQHFYVSDKSRYNINEAFDCLINSVLKSVMSSNNKGNKGKRGRKLDNKEQTEPKNKKGCY